MGRKETKEAIGHSRTGRVTRGDSVAERQANLNADAHRTFKGSANVYAYLGHADADAMQEKARLMTRIGHAIKAQQLPNNQAALAMTPAELGELLASRL